jgi:hypothetical protein
MPADNPAGPIARHTTQFGEKFPGKRDMSIYTLLPSKKNMLGGFNTALASLI